MRTIQHGNTSRADGMSFRNQPARGIDPTFTVDLGFSVDPILCAFAVPGFS